MLVRLGELLEKDIRDVDVPGRWGGKEFVVLLSQATAEETLEVSERPRSVVEARLFDGGLTISLGVVTGPDHAQTAGELHRAADAALYAA